MLARCKKTIALISLVAGSLFTGHVMAVGLGELTVNSSLNEPLDATIQVLGLDGLNESQIDIRLGTLQEFERANMPRVGLIDDITLEVDVLNREEGILHLTSDDPVTEPFLNMVISMRWPNGRLMRDYTALIDLPVLITDEPQAVPVNVPEADDPAPEPRQSAPQSQFLAGDDDDDEPVTTAAPTAPVAEPAPRTSASGDEVVIEPGDTLYDIAAANRPANSVSVEQTMLAIQRANPEAFIDNDINRIRVGRILRIPSLQEVQSIDQSQAVNQIALQNQASTTQPLAFSSNNAGGNTQASDELTILSGEEGTASLSGDSDMAATIAALENQLAISEENLDRARLENQELRSRFAELEEQIEILQNIISMQDARLAQLQADLAATAAAPEPAPEPVSTAVPAQPQPIPAQPVSRDNSLMGQVSALFENTLVLVSSLVALIVLVVGFLVWRRRAAEDEMEEFAIAGGAQATYTADEPEGASAGFLAALKSRFSRSDDDEDDVAVADRDDDDEDDFDDDEDEGLLAKLKGLFSRSSDDDDFADDDDYEDDEDDDDGDDEDADSAFALDAGQDDDDDEDDSATAVAEEEFDLDFNDEDDDSGEDDDDEIDLSLDVDDDAGDDDDDDLDLGNLGDLNLDDDDDDGEEDEDDARDASDEPVASAADTPETFDFEIDDTAGQTPAAETDAEADDDDEVEAFDFSLDDTPKAEAAADDGQDEEDVESFEFSLSDTPAPADDSPADEAPDDDVEKFEFDVSSVSSFDEADNEAQGEESESDSDPLASALDEVDAEAGQAPAGDADEDEDDDVFDLGNIDIDDSMFDEDDEGDADAGTRDESSTKLDLAVAYEAMGDLEGAREILNEVIAEGNESQVAQAKSLLEKWEQS